MKRVLAITRREFYGLLTQRWILILLALTGMDLLLGAGARIINTPEFHLDTVVATVAFLGSLAMIGLSADAVTKERTSGTLELILTRSIDRPHLIIGKLLAYLLICVPVAILAVLLPTGVALILGVPLVLTTPPIELVIPGSMLYLGVYAALGVVISVLCRRLQSAFALGGAIWVTTSPLVWNFLVLPGLQRLLDEKALSWLNVLNPMGAYISTIQYVEDFGVIKDGIIGVGGVAAPTWVAYCVLALELVIVIALALMLFNRQEKPGYQE